MADDQWHLDKRVPIGFFIALFLQTVTLVGVGASWKADTDNRLLQLEKEDGSRSSHETRLIILEQSMNYIRSELAEIKSLLKARP